MTTSERVRYVEAVKKASTDPKYKKDYDQLIKVCKVLLIKFCFDIHGRSVDGAFLTQYFVALLLDRIS